MEKPPINVVEINSSDDEAGGGDGCVGAASSSPPSLQRRHLHSSRPGRFPPSSSSTTDKQSLDSRCFWKAGDYSVAPTNSFSLQGHLEHARVHPKFLHSNATSHKWAFGAIAELLDNAVDEICNGATFVKIDKIYNAKDKSPALLFLDDGGGMDPESMRKCMSLGYSSKKSNTTIGQYGNGFKTSTMRLGADVIVFTRATHSGQATESVGLLSYTLLRTTGQDDVIVPMLDFDISGHWADPILYGSKDDWSSNLKTILEWSPFASKEDLMQQFDEIGPHGTKVIIYNLWLNDEGIYELSFDDDDEDIQLRDEASRGLMIKKVNKRVVELQSHISYRIRHSLRAYTSMLYLRKFTNFQIILRGKPVEQFNIADELKHPKVVIYRPQLSGLSKEVSVETTLGFIKEAPIQICGYNVYHKNRLIRPFWKVTQEGNAYGLGVVGVLEANFIQPAHDKQDFERSSLFIRLEIKLKQILLDYWKSNCALIGIQPPKVSTRRVQNGYSVEDSVMPAENLVDQPVGVKSNLGPESGYRMTINNEGSGVQPSIVISSGSSKEATALNIPGPTIIGQMRAENIKLFVRREEHVRKRNELKQMVEKLEKELADAKRDRTVLSSMVKARREHVKMKF